MVKTDWKNNERDGKLLESAIKQCFTKAKKVDDMHVKAEFYRVAGYLISIKAQLTKVEREKELEDRIAALEQAAGLAQKTKPISQ